ncbi:MAG: hypothetical protein CL878_07205 [Dehalococcoidia bacterium]|nr:hypothetical protein [Dehalococcoidia bacterium]
MDLDPLSLATTPVRLFKAGKEVSFATGFFYFDDEAPEKGVFLATNYHALTGKSPGAKQDLIGDSVQIQFHRSLKDPKRLRTVTLPLLTRNEHPIWAENAHHVRADMAIVPIPLQLYENCQVQCVSSEWAKVDLKVRPSSAVTLIGYPEGYYDTENALPLWKTGHVASEPDMDFKGQPMFLVDVTARRGMSGSPVLAIAQGAYETLDADDTVTVGVVRKFLGILSSGVTIERKMPIRELSRLAALGIVDRDSLDLAHVWKADLLLEAVRGFDTISYANAVEQHLDEGDVMGFSLMPGPRG